MAITAKDIREKNFDQITAPGGYDPDQMDDFLDEVANQLSATTAENQTLAARIADLEAQLANTKAELAFATQAKEAAEAARIAAETRKPEYDEDAYFRDLQNAMHEALTGARRVADEAIAEANRSAAETKANADAYAAKTTSEADAAAKESLDAAQKKVEELTAEADKLDAKNKEFREMLRKLAQEQLEALG